MERLVQSLKVFWRAERLLKVNELRLTIQKVEFTAAAALVAIFGLVMLNLAVFFALAPHMGEALAALTMAGFDLLLALALILRAHSLKPAPEEEMVKEVRDMALGEIENEMALAQEEWEDLKSDVKRIVHNPVETLLPNAIGPLFKAAAKGMAHRKASKAAKSSPKE